MHVIKRKIHTLFHTPRIMMKKFEGSCLFRFLPDETALKIQYKNRFLRDLDLENPRSFNEKLQWLKLYNRQPEYTSMVDKYEAKQYVASLIGEEYIIPTYGVWSSFDDIDFDLLPEQFVLKCTHGSGDVVIVPDKAKFDREAARNKLTKSLKTNYYKISREWPYKNVQPRIIAEQYVMDEVKAELNDYKLMCFHGKVKCCFVCSDRFSTKGLHVTFFDRDWNAMPFEREHPSEKETIQKPGQYERMLEYAEMLSRKIPFLRVDFYEVNGQILFGELTFFPGSGFVRFTPEEWDYRLGEWINLSSVRKTVIR